MSYKIIPKAEYKKEVKKTKKTLCCRVSRHARPTKSRSQRAVEKAKQAGIKTVIITGDYGPTAQAIAQEVGIARKNAARLSVVLTLKT